LLGALALLIAGAAGCTQGSEEPAAAPAVTTATDTGPVIVQPGAPGEDSETLEPEDVDELESPEHTAADVAFMQAMIRHHAQALEMTSYVPARAHGRDLPLFSKRLTISQEDETALMERWLEERGEATKGMHDDAELMPGMLTASELARLKAAKGRAFNRLFLEGMLRHHQGALTMVVELYDAGGGVEPEIDAFARHVEADQAIEIDRIERLLGRP
jgi:uncharacterized protein (DUF305 family)